MARIHHATAKKAAAHKIELIVEDNEVVAMHKGVRLASGLQGNKVLEDAIAKLTPAPITTKAALDKAMIAVSTARGAEITEAGVKVKPAKAPKKEEPKSPFQIAAEEEAWKALRGGGFIQKIEGEEASYSEAKTWEELCEEQDIEIEEPETAEEDEEEKQSASIVKEKYKKIYATSPVKGTNGDDLARQLRDYLMVETEDGMRVDTKKMKRFAEANNIWSPQYRTMKAGLTRMNLSNKLRGNMRKATKAGEKFEIQWPD